MSARARVLGVLLALGAGACAGPRIVIAVRSSPAMTAADADAARARLREAAPPAFRMTHQVVVKARGQSFLATGLLLGRRDGAFRVSGLAPVGPRLFEVAWDGRQWQSQVFVPQLGGRLDPVQIGRAVQRIYFTEAAAPQRSEAGYWVARATVSGDDELDAVEEWRDGATLELRYKRCFKQNRLLLEVEYGDPEALQGQPVARTVRAEDARGLTLLLRVTDYSPDATLDDAVLRLY